MQAALYSLTAAESAGKVMGDSLMTALIGVVVVFATLVVLTLIFILFGKVMHRPKKEAPAVPAPKPKPAAAPKIAPTPAVQDGIPEEVVAVIAAAVASMAPEGKRYAVRKVSRVREGRRSGRRPAWRRAPAVLTGASVDCTANEAAAFSRDGEGTEIHGRTLDGNPKAMGGIRVCPPVQL